MRAHRIVFRFEGRLADQGLLDASDLVAYDTGVRQLLGLHAHFLTTGRVPKGGVPTDGPGYHVYAQDPRVACFEGHWVVQIAEFLTEQAVKGGAGYALKKAAKYGYEQLLKDSLEPILKRKPSSMPRELRIEPVLPGLDRINAPVFDVEAERDHRWGQLRERTTIILPNAFRPVGRSSETLIISGENLRIETVDAATMRRLIEDANIANEHRASRDAQITAAVNQLKLQRPETGLFHPTAGRA